MKSYTVKIGFLSVVAVSVIVFNLAFPQYSLDGAVTGLKICGEIIIPSLFPFCVLALFCQKSGVTAFISHICSPISRKIFHQTGEQFCVFLMSLIGGYPVGMRLIKELYSNGKITLSQAKTMGLYCVNAGPAFIIVAVGEGILLNRICGLYIFAGNMIASVILAITAEIKSKPDETVFDRRRADIGDSFVTATSEAARSMFGICSWVVLFSALISVIDSGFLPDIAEKALLYSLEVSTGVIKAERNIPLIAAIIGFGGLSVHCQVFSACGVCAPKYRFFLIYRLMHSGISAAVTYLFLKLDKRAITTITNNVPFTGHNISFSYACAIALLLTCTVLILSTRQGENNRRKMNKSVLK